MQDQAYKRLLISRIGWFIALLGQVSLATGAGGWVRAMAIVVALCCVAVLWWSFRGGER